MLDFPRHSRPPRGSTQVRKVGQTDAKINTPTAWSSAFESCHSHGRFIAFPYGPRAQWNEIILLIVVERELGTNVAMELASAVCAMSTSRCEPWCCTACRSGRLPISDGRGTHLAQAGIDRSRCRDRVRTGS